MQALIINHFVDFKLNLVNDIACHVMSVMNLTNNQATFIVQGAWSQ